MALRAKTALHLALMAGGLAAMVVFTAPSACAQSAAGPFEALAGSWSGSGVMNTSDGSHERIRCIAKYASQSGGQGVHLDLRCASDSYKVEFTTSINQIGGELSGTWYESTRHIGGNISGRAKGDELDVLAEGDKFTALLNVKTQGSRQTFSLESPGAWLSQFTIALNRGPK